MSCQLTLSLHLNLGASLFVVRTHRRNAISQLQAHLDTIAPSTRHSSRRRAECVLLEEMNQEYKTDRLPEPPVSTHSEHGQSYIPARARRFNQSRG